MKTTTMTPAATAFLQTMIVLIGIGTLAFLLFEPNVEGVNANATTFTEIYLDDPFLAYVYAGSIVFFVALYQAFTLLGHIRRNDVYSPQSVKTVRTIKYCGMVLFAFVAGAGFFLFVMERGKSDDIAGGVAMCVAAVFVSVIITTAAAMLEKRLQNAQLSSAGHS